MTQAFARETDEAREGKRRDGRIERPEAARASRQTRIAADAVFVGLALVAIIIRAHALSRAGAPPGYDGGDWLGLARGLFGKPVRPRGIAASPVVPILTYTSVKLFGAEFTFVSFGAVLGVLPGAGVYAALRNRISALDAALVSALVIACAGSGEAASWGGYPQLIALGLLPIAVVLVDRAFDRAEPALAVLAGFVLAGVFLVSDFVFTFAALAAFAVVAARLFSLIQFVGWRRAANLVLVVLAPLLLALPLALKIAKVRVDAVLHPAGTTVITPSAIDRINFVFGDRIVLWRIILLAGLAAVVLLWERRYETHWRIAAVLLAIGLGLTLMFAEPRLAYLLPTAAAISAALWSAELRRVSRVPLFALLAGLACVVQFQSLPAKARLQADWYQALTPDVVQAIGWVRTHTNASALVAVTPYKDGPALGWWVEGLAGRHTLTGSNLRWLHFDSERATAIEAARLFAAGVPTDVVLRQAKAMHVNYLFIDKRWSSFQSGRVKTLRREVPNCVVFENSTTVVLTTATA